VVLAADDEAVSIETNALGILGSSNHAVLLVSGHAAIAMANQFFAAIAPINPPTLGANDIFSVIALQYCWCIVTYTGHTRRDTGSAPGARTYRSAIPT